jgi:hypothetical protein
MTRKERDAERKRRIAAGESIDNLPSDDELDEEDDDDSDEEEDDEESDDSDEEEDDEESDDSDEEEDETDDEDIDPKKVKTLKIQRKKHKKRADTAEARVAELEAENERLKGGKSPKSKKTDDNRSQERNDFRFDYPDLKSSEVDQVEAYAKAAGISMREASKKTIVKLMIKRARKRRASGAASTDTTRRSSPHIKKQDWDGKTRPEMEQEAQRRRDELRNKK